MSRLLLLSLGLAGVMSLDAGAQSGNAPVTGGDHLRIRQSLDAEWAFHRGDAPGAEQPAYDDRGWRRLDVPHDWSIEDVPVDDKGRPPVLALVPGAWRFHEGDDPAWKDAALDDRAWSSVMLPAAWGDHAGYTKENGFGWYRRRIEMPANARGGDVILDLGRIDDADETYVNGEKVGSRGSMPPAWYDPFWSATWPYARFYRVPAKVLRGDGSDVIAVRVFGGPGRGGIYGASSSPRPSGPFDPALSGGGIDTGHVVGGVGWYRRRLVAPEAWRGRRVTLEFEGVYRNAEVWINGRSLGAWPYGYTTFSHDLTPHLRFGAQGNVLAVRVNNDGANSRWYTGSGIYRHVWLTVNGPVRVADGGVFVTTPSVSEEAASVHVEVTARNDSVTRQALVTRVRLVAADGTEAAQAEGAAQTVAAAGETSIIVPLTIKRPQRWSPETPRLYRALTELVIDGVVVDRIDTPFGIRAIRIDAARGLLVNGVPTKLRGACVHHDNGPLGAAAIDRAEERRVELLKASGFNAIRTSHNPPSVAFLDAADRLGMLVMNEPFDMWRQAKRPDDYHRDFDAWWQRDLDALVRRDRNHPSVILWSIGNEIPERGEPAGHEWARRIAGRIRSVDPTRGISGAINRVTPWTNADPSFAVMDVAGYNYLYEQYEPDHDRVPGRVIAATESAPPAAFEAWMGVVDHPYVIGDFVWTGIDYLGESGIGHSRLEGEAGSFLLDFPWHVSNCGDIDICGWKRPQSYYRDVLWGRGDPLYIAVHRPLESTPAGTPANPAARPVGQDVGSAHAPKEIVSMWGWPDVEPSWLWPGEDGHPMQVEIYSAADRVELFLNGTRIGAQPTSRASRFTASFTVPYAPGVLRAVGYTGDREIASTELRTPGPPAALRLTADRASIAASRNDLSYVTVEVVDASGTRVPTAAHRIHFAVTGPAEIAAVANSDPADPSGYRGDTRAAWKGRALAIVRPTGQGAGEVLLTASAEGLVSGTVRIAVATPGVAAVRGAR